VADLTLISTKNIDLSNAQLDARAGKRVSGKDCGSLVLGFIPVSFPDLEDAVDQALELGGGNVMVDQVTHQSAVWLVLFSYHCIRAEGTVLQTASAP
jgi:hypothetical protein